jgi:hemoglobin
MKNIYEAIGGEAALEAAVQRFYERVTADPSLTSFFQGTDLRRLRSHQIAFLGQALGGPTRYEGQGMQRAHQHLRIEQRHFDLVVLHLTGTLRELAVSEEVIDTIVGRLAPLASQIVNTPSREVCAAP